MVQVVHATIPVSPAQVGQTEWAEAHAVTDLLIADVTGLQGELAGKSATDHTHAGVYEPADATILKDADIGVSVAAEGHTHAYDATGTAAAAIIAHEGLSDPHPTYLTQAEGDALYADDWHTHSGVYEPADATILKDADIGSSVAAFNHTHAYLADAPADGNEYVRKDGAWVIEADGGGGGLTQPQVMARGLGA